MMPDTVLYILRRFSDRLRVFTLAFFVTACGIGTEGVAPVLPSDQVLARVRLDHHVYNLATAAPYNTVQLRAIGYSGTGQVIDAPVEFSVGFAAASMEKLSVSPTGVLTASAAGSALVVRASMQQNGVTRTDSAFVYVINGTPSQHLARLEFDHSSQDGLVTPAFRLISVPLTRTDTLGKIMEPLPIAIRFADPTIRDYFFMDDGEDTKGISLGGGLMFSGGRPGRTMIYADTYAYGVSLKDSLSVQVGWPIEEIIDVMDKFRPGTLFREPSFAPRQLVVGLGGCVKWNNISDSEIDVTFDDPSVVGPPPSQNIPGLLCKIHGRLDLNGGNIAPFKGDRYASGGVITPSQYRVRSFSKPGIYKYRSTLWGTTGTIIVCDEKGNNPLCSPDNYKWLLPIDK